MTSKMNVQYISCFMAHMLGLLGLPWKCKPLLAQEGDGRGAFGIWRSNLCASELKHASAQYMGMRGVRFTPHIQGEVSVLRFEGYLVQLP